MELSHIQETMEVSSPLSVSLWSQIGLTFAIATFLLASNFTTGNAQQQQQQMINQYGGMDNQVPGGETIQDLNNMDSMLLEELKQQENASLPLALNNEQNPPVNPTDVLESNDAVDVISRQLVQLRTIAPEANIENSTTTEIADLLEFYGLDTEGPVCPPCSESGE